MTTPLYLARKKAGISQLDLCAKLDIDQGYLSRLERGLVQASPEMAAKIAAVFKGKLTEIEILYPERPVKRKAAVPKGWQVVRKKVSSEQVEVVQVCIKRNTSIQTLWDSLLDTAPKFKEEED